MAADGGTCPHALDIQRYVLQRDIPEFDVVAGRFGGPEPPQDGVARERRLKRERPPYRQAALEQSERRLAGNTVSRSRLHRINLAGDPVRVDHHLDWVR